MGNIALQIERTASGSTVASTARVVFNSLVYSTGDIDYNTSTGIITLNSPGRYIINWWVAIQSTGTANGMIFSLLSSQSDSITGSSPQIAGQVNGIGIIDVVSAPVTLSLINSSTGTLTYSVAMPVKASLTVFKDEPSEDSNDTTSLCFSYAQLAHVIEQLITIYPESVMSVFTTNVNTVIGTPYQLYASPDGDNEAIFILTDELGQFQAVPITLITAIYVGDDTLYDDNITYLTPPSPLPKGCDTDIIAAIRDYLPISTEVIMQMGVTIEASGAIYKNEYGILVLSDEEGNTPIFIPVIHIARIITAPPNPERDTIPISIINKPELNSPNKPNNPDNLNPND
jgi:hypothetical protein